MSEPISEHAVRTASGELRVSEAVVRSVVYTYLQHAGEIVTVTHTGGGWYLLPDGSKVQGKGNLPANVNIIEG